MSNRPEIRPLFDLAHEEAADLKAVASRKQDNALPVWFQLVVTSVDAEIVPPTRVGIGPFDNDTIGDTLSFRTC